MIVDEHIAAYINSLESELPEYLAALEIQAKCDEVPIIRKEAQTLLRFLLSIKMPKNILEIGTAVGFSCCCMAEWTRKNSKITTIEKVSKRFEEAKINISLSPYAEQITLLMGDALDILPALKKGTAGMETFQVYHQGKEGADRNIIDPAYDFIFMDAAKAQYMNYLPEIIKLLTDGGILVTDNVLQEGSVAESKYSIPRRDRTIHMRMREYLYTITHCKEFETVILPVGDGMALSHKREYKNFIG